MIRIPVTPIGWRQFTVPARRWKERKAGCCDLVVNSSASVAALHLTPRGLHGTVRPSQIMLSGLPMRASTSLKSLRFAAVLGLLFGTLSLGEARAANPLELNFWLSGPRYDGNVSECDRALPTIASQFLEKESSFWNSSLKITGFAAVHETAFRPWASDNIPRRYCSGEAMLTDGKMRKVHFSIVEDGGFAGFGQGVEWCVVGLDRNWAYNPSCRAAKP
jgi:hypothetical protein